MSKEMLIKILKWIAILPLSFISCMLVIFILNLWNKYYYPSILSEIIANIGGGIAFVYVGFYLAPSYKVISTIILTIIFMVVCLISLYLGIYVVDSEYLTILGLICSIIGSIGCCAVLYNSENQRIKNLD